MIPAFPKDLVFIDIETTGLDAFRGSRIVEVAALKSKREGGEEYFQHLVNPGMSIPREAWAIHKISDSMVKDASCIEEVMKLFLVFVEDSCILGYNLDFDLSFIQRYVPREFFREHLFIDILKMVRYCFPSLGKFSLSYVCQNLNIKTSNLHRALDDTLASKEVFFACLDILSPGEIIALEDLTKRFPSNYAKI